MWFKIMILNSVVMNGKSWWYLHFDLKKKIKIHNNELQFPLMTVNKISFLYEWARLHRINNLWELKLFSCWFWLNEFFYFILKNVSKNDTTYMRIL